MAAALPSLTPARDRRNHASREALLQRIRVEFIEMRCLRLTRRQAQRLFALRPDICDRVLAELVHNGVLACGGDDRYRINDSGVWTPHSAFLEAIDDLPRKAS
jgi:hypothetical protein